VLPLQPVLLQAVKTNPAFFQRYNIPVPENTPENKYH
jgi:hypothetical protein